MINNIKDWLIVFVLSLATWFVLGKMFNGVYPEKYETLTIVVFCGVVYAAIKRLAKKPAKNGEG